MQDSGKPEDARTAEPEGAKAEETRRSISRRQGREKPGKPGSSNPRPSRKVKRVGKPAATPGGAAGRSGVRGKPKAQAPEAPKNERFGVTRSSVAGRAGRCRSRGNPGNVSAGATGRARGGETQTGAPEALKDTRGGATRGSVAGRAGRCKDGETRDASRGATGEIELRGNPELEDRWKRRKESRFRAT